MRIHLRQRPAGLIHPLRIGQVLGNLLSNATKFTEKGSISYGYEPRENGVYVYVKDTGIGMQAKAMAHIFERFEKIEGVAVIDPRTIAMIIDNDFGAGENFNAKTGRLISTKRSPSMFVWLELDKPL